MDSPLFADLITPNTPSVLMTDTFKRDGIYVGEGVIKQVLKNGQYLVTTNDNRNIACRGVSNVGESIFPKGIAVFVVVYNAEGFVLGKLRVIRDEDKDDGTVEQDKSTTIGSEGDAQIRPQTLNEENVDSEVTVTSGGVVKIKSTGATGITLHPHGEQIIQKSQRLLAFTDAYRIESGRLASKTGVVLDVLTAETYKSKAGPSRVEIRVKNGKVDGSIVHRTSVENLVTGGGKTLGTRDFSSEIDDSGNWKIANTSSIKFGDASNEPVVLGNQLVTLLKQVITEMTSVRTALTTYTAALTAAGATAASTAGGAPLPPNNQAAILTLSSALTSAGAPVAASLGKSIASLTVLQTTFLTAMGVSKELILSDFFSTQKVPPIPGVVSE